MRLTSQLTKIEADATPTEILTAASLDWEVEKCPRSFKYQDEFREVPKEYSLIRTDRVTELDTCSARWHPQQNIDIINLAYEAFKSQNISISYAGAINNSRGITLVADWKEIPIGPKYLGDIVEGKVIIIGSHQVGVGHSVKIYLNRLVCLNGMTRPVWKTKKVIGHTNRAIQILEKSLVNAEEHFNSFKETADKLTQKPIEYVEAQALLIKEFGDPNLPVSQQPRLVQIVLNLFNGKGKGQELLTSYQTAWGLLNSLTEYYSHSRYSRSSDRLNSLVNGTAYQHTQKLQNSLLNYVESREESQVKQSVLV